MTLFEGAADVVDKWIGDFLGIEAEFHGQLIGKLRTEELGY